MDLGFQQAGRVHRSMPERRKIQNRGSAGSPRNGVSKIVSMIIWVHFESGKLSPIKIKIVSTLGPGYSPIY